MWEQARLRQEATILRPSSEKSGVDSSLIIHHVDMTALPQQDSSHHQTDTAHAQTDDSCSHFQASNLPNHLAYEFIGDLVLVNYCPFGGGDVGQPMHWHTECVIWIMFRSWSLATQILVTERLEARCEEFKSQTGDRPVILAIMRKPQLQAVVVQRLGRTRNGVCGNFDKRRKNCPSERNDSHLVGTGSESKESRGWPWNGTSPFVAPTASAR